MDRKVAQYSLRMLSQTFSGHEQRNINWQEALARYDVGSGIKTEKEWQQLIAFFRARRGRAIGFRYKDWSDYRAVNQLIGTGDDQVYEFQLVKIYNSGSQLLPLEVGV